MEPSGCTSSWLSWVCASSEPISQQGAELTCAPSTTLNPSESCTLLLRTMSGSMTVLAQEILHVPTQISQVDSLDSPQPQEDKLIPTGRTLMGWPCEHNNMWVGWQGVVEAPPKQRSDSKSIGRP
eukprot:6476571-Amphidinium_carterae.1